MKKTGIICLFFLLPGLAVKANHPYPSFYNVVTQFFEKYQSEEINTKPYFIKDKTGWKVHKAKYKDGEKIIYDSELFWDQSAGKFLPLKSYPKTTAPYRVSKIESIENYCLENRGEWFFYERSPYYGYTDWEKDVINDFGNLNGQLSDTLKEGLCRAFEKYADGYMFHCYEQSNDTSDLLRKRLTDISLPNKQRIKAFCQAEDKSLEYCRSLIETNPDYETLVGNIRIKYFNQLNNTYYLLKMCKEDDLAKKYLDQMQLEECYVNFAKNFLNSLKPNAILLTNGDNDTYPLMYVQNKFNFRKDVTVVNQSLLQAPAYIHYLYRKKVDFVTPLTMYEEEKLHWLYYFPKEESNAKLQPVLNVILEALRQKSDYPYYYFSQKETYIEIGENKIPVTLGNYVGLGERMCLDIIQTNINKKPIYFTYFPQYIKSENLQNNGCFAVQLLEKDSIAGEENLLKYIKSEENYFSTIYLNPFSSGEVKDNQLDTYSFSYLFTKYDWICSYYAGNDQMEKATSKMKDFCRHFENRPYPYYKGFTSVVSSLYKYKCVDEARRFSDETVSKLEQIIFSPNSLNYEFITKISNEISYLRQIEACNNGDITKCEELLMKIQDFVIAENEYIKKP